MSKLQPKTRCLFLSFFFSNQTPSPLKPFSTNATHNLSQTRIPTSSSSFTLSYLINSCGLSPQSAISVSQKIQLKSAENPDSVLACFRNHGFTETQIRKIIIGWPRFLLAKPEKTLLPKFQYFQDLGIPIELLTKVFSSGPSFLCRSLHNKIIPYVEFIKTYLHSTEDIILSLNHLTRFYVSDFRSIEVMKTNVKILRENGVPELFILRLIARHPAALMQTSARFDEIVRMVKQVGFDPCSKNSNLAIRVVSSVSKSKLEEKANVFKSLGWSEDELLRAFKRQPMLMAISQKKIKRVASFFADEMGWKLCDLARYPNILILSLEKRIVPRCAVLKMLWSKGILMQKHCSVAAVLKVSDEAFSERYLIKYQELIPEILTLYQGKFRNSKSEESKTDC
ncbi:hypothetical protein ACLOJK_025618 [Asimina triloba]